MKRKLYIRMTIMILFLVIVFGGVFGWDVLRGYFMKQYFAHYQPPPVAISTTKAEQQSWQPYLHSVGTLEAVNGVNISPEVSGIIEKFYFESGEKVKAGQLLIKLNDSTEQAQLQNNLAQLTLNKINYQRIADLYKKNAASESQRDEAEAKLKQAQAEVDQVQSEIAKKNITAPFSGRLGIRSVNIGQYVSPGTELVPLQAVSPIHVDFYLPEQNIPKLYLGQAVELTVDIDPKKVFTGKITAIDSKVDVQTHNIMVQATLPNEDEKLYPGLFANIRVLLPENQNVVTVPETAVTFSLFGNSVYTLYEDGKDQDGKPVLRVKQQYVETGESRDGKIIILQGIKAGDEVVTSGQLKLDNDTRVAINNTVNLGK